MNPDRKTLLAWLDTLSTSTLLKFWRKANRDYNLSKYRRRRHSIEAVVTAFRYLNPNPQPLDWRDLARNLQARGLYSRKTYICDIVDRIQKL